MTRHALLVAGLLGAAALSASCDDPVHDSTIDALGPEDPSVPRGPNHRPGQPCVECHQSEGPASTVFLFGGTVFATQGASNPASGVTVHLTDSNGDMHDVTTNDAGNFWVTPSDWSPTLPVNVSIEDTNAGVGQAMNSHIGHAGSCAFCHTPNVGPTSPGPVYVNGANP